MSIIDTTYFHSNIKASNSDAIGAAENLTNFIDKYEHKLMMDLLGYNLYKKYEEYLLNLIDARFLKLIDGTAYISVNGITKQWRGLKNVMGTKNYSIIAYYVYFYWSRSGATKTTGVGEAIPKTSNANRTSSFDKQVYAWNEMVEWACELYSYLDANRVLYPEWQGVCWKRDYYTKLNPLGI